MKVEISQEEHDELVKDALMLTALQSAGVDNWEGYELALEIFEELQNGS